jgi:acyl dehydratase
MALRFVRLVFVGDRVDIAATVLTWTPERDRLVLRVEARNQERRRVLAGSATVIVRRLGGRAVSAAGRAILGHLCC